MSAKLPVKIYREQKHILQLELLKVQRWAQQTNQRLLVLFEGRDASGKGGTIKRFTEHLNPRVPVLLLYRNRAAPNRVSGIFSAISSIYRQPEKSCCLIAVGTTVLVLNA